MSSLSKVSVTGVFHILLPILKKTQEGKLSEFSLTNLIHHKISINYGERQI